MDVARTWRRKTLEGVASDSPKVMSILLRSFLVCVGAMVAGGCSAPSDIGNDVAPVANMANVAQSGPNPIVFDQTAVIDNVTYLIAAGARHSSGLTVLYPEAFPKHFWINNFTETSQFLEWSIFLEDAADYRVEALLSATEGETFNLSLVGNAEELKFSKLTDGWTKQDVGTISLPAGQSKLRFVRTSSEANVDIKSLELVREKDLALRKQRIVDFKADTTWFSQAGFGLMFQYGPWGYPRTGPKKDLEDQANSFDVDSFVATVKETGASYVIWSLTWWEYVMNSPISSVDTLIGNSDRTSTRDLVGEIMIALDAEGIDFMLYYHRGHEDDPWFDAAVFPPVEFPQRGTGDRSVLFDNWVTIISEIGERYGDKLDGWFFDDGVVYYPAPFERMGVAARAGNPNRLVSHNAWISARVTDFQDVMFGEGNHGEEIAGSDDINGTGLLSDGPSAGLLQHGMFMTENDWGIHDEDQEIETRVTPAEAAAWRAAAAARNVPISFTLMMWEDGSMSQESLDIF